jgi:N-acetylmuramoyl-L-alanine amidase
MTYAIINDRLLSEGQPVAFRPTPNVGGRIEPWLIVVHDTAGRVEKGTSVDWLCNPRSKASAHLVIERDGTVTQLAAFDRATWHAGPSTWKGCSNCNGFSIGIELVNPGRLLSRGDAAVAWFGQTWPKSELIHLATHAHGDGWWLPYTDAQLEACRGIVRALIEAYPTITDIAAHWQIAPGRKVDTGPHFPLADLHLLLQAAGREAPDRQMVRAAQERLAALGYFPGGIDGNVGPRTRSAVRSFQEQNGLVVTGTLDPTTIAAIEDANARPAVTGPRESVRAGDVPHAQDARRAKRAIEGTGAVLAGEAAAEAAKTPAADVAVLPLDTVDDWVTRVEQGRSLGDRLMDIAHWLASPRGQLTSLMLLALLAAWFIADRIDWRGLLDFRSGRQVSH